MQKQDLEHRKNDKSPGVDNVLPEILTLDSEITVQSLKSIF